MQTTKGQILTLLKRRGRSTVDGLADELGLAPMTVRQHLTSLERDGLIAASTERRPKGRPHYVFTLTEKGDDTFPKRYDQLAMQVLTELGRIDAHDIEGLNPSERTAFMLDRIADRLVTQHAVRLHDCTLEERVREVASVLQRESGFVEWSRTGDCYEIADYNCIYRPLTDEHSQLCSWHRRIIGRLVGVPPIIAHDAEQAACCRYVLLARAQTRQRREGRNRPGLQEVEGIISEEVH